MARKISRRFSIHDPLKHVFLFVETQIDFDLFEIGIKFPKRALFDHGQTIKESDIPNNAALYVEKIS